MSTLEIQQESFIKNYHDNLLPPIFIDQGNLAENNLSLPEFITPVEPQQIISVIDNTRLTILLAADQLTNVHIIKSLQNAADKNIRIYLYLGDENKNKEAISALSSRCLIRTGETQQGALLISDHATFSPIGYILNSSTTLTDIESVNKNFVVTLTASQIQDAYRSFCYLFWDKSRKQIIKQGEKSVIAVKNPEGTIVVNHDHHLPEQLAGNFIQSRNLKFSQINHHPLEQSLSNKLLQATNSILDISKAKLAASLVENNKNVVLTDLNIPNIVTTNSACWFIPDDANNQNVNWCIKFNDEQSAKLDNSLNKAFEASQWQLDKSCTIDKLNSPFMFVDETDNIYECEERLDIKLTPIFTDNMNSFLNDSIEDLTSSLTNFKRDKLAKTIHYNVQRHPPYCPKNASKAKLYTQWAKANDTWLTALGDLEVRLDKLNKKRTSVSESIMSFFNPFSLGQQHKHKKLHKRIQVLHELDMIVATPAERLEQESNYAQCFNELSKDDNDTNIAIKKANLQKQWNDQKEQLSKNLKHKEEIYSQEKRSVNRLNKTKADKYHQADIEFIASRDKALEDRSQVLKQENEKLVAMSLQQVIQWFNKNKKSDPKLSELLKHYLTRVKEIERTHRSEKISKEDKERINEQHQQQILDNQERLLTKWKTHWEQTFTIQQEENTKISSMKPDSLEKWLKINSNKSLKKALETHIQLNKKIDRDLDSAQKKTDNALNDKKIALDALTEHGSEFSFKNNSENDELSKLLGNKKQQIQAQDIRWPDEALPMGNEFELFEVNEKRYLTLLSLDLLEQAELEAQRLNAKLCVQQPAKG